MGKQLSFKPRDITVAVSENCNPLGMRQGKGQMRNYVKRKRWSFPQCGGKVEVGSEICDSILSFRTIEIGKCVKSHGNTKLSFLKKLFAFN